MEARRVRFHPLATSDVPWNDLELGAGANRLALLGPVPAHDWGTEHPKAAGTFDELCALTA
jgi:hypothetical protein